MIFLADDLSGANDVACQLFKNGYPCSTVDSKNARHFDSSALFVLNTSSRSLSSRVAYNIVYQAVKSKASVYKKMDSTLRGNVGSEIDACIDALKTNKAALVPAFPELGRVTVYGRHFLNGKVLETTEFAHDPSNPVKSSSILDLLKEQSKYKAELVDIDTVRKGSRAVKDLIRQKSGKTPVIFVFDCLTNSDLKTISESVKDFKVVAGASALAGFIFRKKITIKPRLEKAGKGTAYLIGSVKAITHKQLNLLASSQKIPVVHVLNYKPGCTNGKDAIITVNHIKTTGIVKTRRKIETAFAKAAKELVNKQHYGKLFISGGSTAETVMKALNITQTEVKSVLLTGVPLTYSPQKKIYVVTKPGGYGERDALSNIHLKLNKLR